LYLVYAILSHRNEELYTDIATSVQFHTKEILRERDEILQRLEEIERAEQLVRSVHVNE